MSSPPSWLLGSLAVRNLARRKTRTTLLIAAVAVASAVAFSGATVMRSIAASLEIGFSRLGADLMVVPQGALTNITAALLTVEPSDQTLDADLVARANIAGIGRAAPQRIYRTEQSGFAGPAESVDLVGFDPGTDFTVRPWIADRLDRPPGPDDVLLGSARAQPLGSEITLFGKSFRVYGRLNRTGVGTHERGIFLPMPALLALAPAIGERTGRIPPMLEPDRVSGFLIALAPGATELQVRFALLSRRPDVKVITGATLLTGIRQGLTALFGGAAALAGFTLASTGVLLGVLFSAIVSERRNELGLLKVMGARRSQIVGLTVVEAMAVTGAGGVFGVLCGLLLLRLFERSLVYQLTRIGVPFVWIDRTSILILAIVCVGAAALAGVVSAFLPAWRASRRDAYDLIRERG